uniref:CSON002371 protein n=1 Tax=Culicoides sonorensis TaxID=179676 RepID=A0A336K775_CULSO
MDGQKNYNLSQENHSQYTYGRPQDLYLADQFQQQQQQQQQQYYFNSVYDTEYTQKYISPGNEDMFRSFETTPTQTQPYSMKQYNNPKLLEKIEQDYDDYSPLRMHSKSQTTATSRFKQQYQQLQEEKMRLQIKTQNDAFLQQQQTFALRQQLNPPVPSMYPQSPISVNSQLSILQQQEHYKLPPTNLNLGTQYYYIPENKQERIDYSEPNSGKDFSHKQDISGQFQQNSRELLSPLHNQVIIQQNHPNKVVNQAVQTQMSDTSQKSSSSTSNTPQSPSHNIIERRKSESLKSPIIKRMQGAPISLSGYLYKQGSDGLKVWKKRYFVLSEYCLFYYKSNEQEKLLGSVLLPSYTISPCTFEDKVYRKYAFKCEHTNMRTYVLAAETQKSMDNWITYLRMAATMQDNTENSTPSSNKSCNISELPIFQTQITEAEALSSPNEKQPMYINAPPKPLRKAASDVNYLEHHEQDLYDAPRNTIQLVDSQSVFGYHNEMVRTDILEKGTNSTQDCKPKNENSLSSKKNLSTYSIKYADQQTTGRRTPNEYSLQEVPLNKTSYEDDYGAMDKNYYVHTKNYRRPLSPRNNIHSKNYNINDQLQVSPLCVQVRDKTVTQQVPRPHSAEFLDLENRLNLMPNELQKGQATRPKSSLDINRALDHFYYSEESYAEQMRSESANYIQKSKFKVNPMYPEVPNLKQAESRAQKISKRTLRQQEFLRSASARVPRKDEIQSQTNDNDKKREESMKRLLEWKQRMLQSPLTRKTTSQTNTLPLENRQSVSERLKNNMHRTRSDVIKTNDNYNSFSSDDEDGARMARRSDNTHSPILHVESPAQNNESHPKTNNHKAFNQNLNNTNNSIISLSTSLYSQSYKPVYAYKTAVTLSTDIEKSSFNHVSDERNANLAQTNELVNLNIINSENNNTKDQTINTPFEYTDDDLNEVLLSSRSDTDITEIHERIPIFFTENHYMPMTQKKGSEPSNVSLDILDSIKKCNEISEENAYIEMMTSRENCTENKSTYEFISINNNLKKIKSKQLFEPVYMELSENKSIIKRLLDLPDILKEPIISNSASSLNKIASVEKYIKRLSLSDTFRPASYYLPAVNNPRIECNSLNDLLTEDENDILTNLNKERNFYKNQSFELNGQNINFEDHVKTKLQIGSQLSLPEKFSEQNKEIVENKLSKNCDNQEKNCQVNTDSSNSNIDKPFLSFENNNLEPPHGFGNSSFYTNNNSHLSKSLNLANSNSLYDSKDFKMNFEDTNNLNENSINHSKGEKLALYDIGFPVCVPVECPKNNNFGSPPYYYSDITNSPKIKDEFDESIIGKCKLNNLKDVNVQKGGIPHIQNIIFQKMEAEDNGELKDKPIGTKKKIEQNVNMLQTSTKKETDDVLFDSRSLISKDEISNLLVEENSFLLDKFHRISDRHTKSMSELRHIEEKIKKNKNNKKQTSKLTRDVTYVNDEICLKEKSILKKSYDNIRRPNDSDEGDDVYVQLAVTEDLYETLRQEDTQKIYLSIDREKIRQWDLMSSGLHLASSVNNIHKIMQGLLKYILFYASISVKTINFLPKGNLTIKTEPSKPRQNLPRDNDNEAILPCYEKPNDINFEIIDKHNKIKAGELLNRTHEELVLLLIHLRKENTIVVRHIEKCCTKIHEVQNNIRITDGKEKEENLSKLNHLKQQLSKLEKKYEENKPLVNLVDNMVKLGSFYNKNAEMHYTNTLLTEQNQKEQERRMFADEQKQWERISPNPFELKNKVQQLDELDQLLNQESNTLQSLQRDKEGIEQAISGLQTQLENNDTSNSALIAARRQQHILEQEKLEEELLVLRQKLQMSRDMKEIYANSEGVSSYGSGATAILESELRRVQVLVADMQRQREDLCIAVRQLTDNSNSLYNQLKKRSDFKHDWSETDMDNKQQTIVKDINSSKVYYGDEGKKEQFIQENMPIKTVRIVKREAGKRQKDRERVDKSLNNLEEVLQEELNVLQEYNQNRDRLQLRDYKLSGNFCLEQFENRPFIVTLGENSNPTVGENKNSKLDSNTVYQSEAAKQIITEMSYNSQENLEADMNKRLIPKEKKRHNTAPHHINSQFIEQMQSNKKLNNNEGNFRALDDIDIEVAIRPRLNAPDVIKSAIGQREKISESTIDKLFTTPDKILIPERYIADEELELSPDEEKKRKQKVEAIKKMLRETPSVSMSKIVAARALQFTPSTVQKLQFELSDDDDDSPIEPLPIYQIRENFYA